MSSLLDQPQACNALHHDLYLSPAIPSAIRDECLAYVTDQVKFAAWSDRRLAPHCQDITQDAMLAIAQSLPGFDGRCSLRTWLTSITTNKIVDMQRKLGRHPTCSLDEENDRSGQDSLADLVSPDVADEYLTHEEHCESIARARRVWSVILRACERRYVPGDAKKILYMALIDQLKHQDIADRMGTTASAVTQLVRRVIGEVREELARNR